MGCRQRNSSGGGRIGFALQWAEMVQFVAEVEANVLFLMRLSTNAVT
jgi:hypothetical protein